jgi:hypothetical protein
LSGVCEVHWGAKGEYSACAKTGDFIHVPAFLPHMEINASDSEAFHWVVVRSTSTPIVVNLPDHTWPWARRVLAVDAFLTPAVWDNKTLEQPYVASPTPLCNG